MKKLRAQSVVGTLLMASTLVLAACASTQSPGATTSNASSSGSTSYPASFKTDVATLLGPKGSYQPPPTSAPKVAPGKKIFLISCGQAYLACSIPMGAAASAVKSLGWTPVLVDSKGDPAAMSSGILSAIAQKANGIFMYYIDCDFVKTALEQAKAAGIPVVAAESVDCSPPLFAGTVTYAGGDSYLTWVGKWFDAMVEYAIVAKNGKANMLMFTDNTTQGSLHIAQTGAAVARQCSTCTFHAITFPISDIGTKLQGETQEALLKYPNTNVVIVGYEGVLVGGVWAGIQAAGRTDLLVGIGEGNVAGTALFKQQAGKNMFGSGIPLEWEAYSGIDGLLRIIDGAKPLSSGIGVQLFDATHNAPISNRYTAPFNYVALYRQAWGVS